MIYFLKKHAVLLASAAAVFLLAVILMSVYIFRDYKDDIKEEKYYIDLYELEMKSSAYFLRDSLDKDDTIESYHNSEMAADWAERAGLTKEAEFFTRISASIKEGKNGEYKEILDSYIKNGEFKLPDYDGESSDEAFTEKKNEYVPSFQTERAGKIANELFGTKNVLHLIENTNGNVLIFSCHNAYAVIDSKSCVPLEASLSLEYKENNLSDDECVAYAKKFIENFYPIDIFESASLVGIKEESNNTLNTDFLSNGRKISLFIDKSRGRVVGITTG